MLAAKYDGQDRFYLAALNIACGTDPERREAILADFDKHFPEWNDKVADLVWELRPKCMLAKMDGYLKDAKLTPTQKARIVDILAGSEDASAGQSVLSLLTGDHPAEVMARAIDHLKQFLPTKWKSLANSKEIIATMDALLKEPKTRVTGLQLIAAVKANDRLNDIRKLTALSPKGDGETDDVVLEAFRTLGALRDAQSVATLQFNLMRGGPRESEMQAAVIRSLGMLVEPQAKDEVSGKALKVLQDIVQGQAFVKTDAVKRLAIDELAGTSAGSNWLIGLKDKNAFPAGLESGAGILLRNSPHRGVAEKAKALFPVAAKLDLKTLPSNAALARIAGNAGNGKKVFLASFKGEAQCMKCHKVNKEGGEIGPDLSTIGKKASRENLFESILQPSKAIADQFVTWKVETDDGQSITGLLVKESPTEIVLRDANGKDYLLPAKGTQKKKLPTSLMPEDIAKSLTEQELIDLVEYLFSLKE